MKTPKPVIFFILAGLFLTATLPAKGADEVPGLLTQKSLEAVEADLGTVIPRLMKEARIPGLQIALVRDGRTVWLRSFGVANAATSVPVTNETIFEAASFTKPFFAYYVLKLVERGVVDLDKPLIGYLPREDIEKMLGHPLDAEGFHRDWFERITARHVLSHSSGMPHGETGMPYPLAFEPGTKWKYSAEGYFLLQRVVERLEGDKLENLMRKDVIEPLGMSRSSLVWKDEYEKTMANGHGFFGKPEDFRKRTEAHAAATLYTTAGDYAKFVCAVINGTGLRPETLKAMQTPQIDVDKEKGLGWSLGFGTQTDANGMAFWQWGDYGIFRNYVYLYPREKTAVVYFTNSFYGLGISPDLVGHSLGGQDLASVALKYWPYDSPIYRLGWDLEAKGPEAASELKSLMSGNPGVFERDAIGFLVDVFQEAGLARQVIALLESYAGERSQSGAAQADLGKAYLAQGDRTRARKAFDAALAAGEDKVEPSIIKWNLEDIQALDHPQALEESALRRIAGDYGPRHLEFREGRLYYHRDGGVYSGLRALTPMTEDTFLVEGATGFRLKVEFDDKGEPVKLAGLYEDGRKEETARNITGAEGAWKQIARPGDAGWSIQKLEAARAFAETLNSAVVMAVHRGKVVAAWGDPARRIELHSVRKSLVSALFGPLVASSRLDLSQTLGDLGIDDLQPLSAEEKKAKVSDLLAARSGIYHPAAKETRDVKANRPARGSHPAGEFWWYNNWDFNTSGVILERAAGRGLFEEFEARIAGPLGMEDFRVRDGYRQFERSLSIHPAHGFRMSACDLARFGQLYVNGGRWNGRDVIPETWVRESTRIHSEVREGTGYGYMWWIYPKGGLGKNYPELSRYDQFAAIGSGGQLLLVVPEAGYVFVHLADTGAGQEVSGKNVWKLAEMILESRIADPAGEPPTVDMAPTPYKTSLPAEKEWKEVSLPLSILSRYPGDYRAESGLRISFRVEDSFLIGAVPGLGEWDFIAESETEFFVKSEGVTVRFLLDEKGGVVGGALTLSGKPVSLVKEK